MKNERSKNIIKGCIAGGAIGDALGYPVEFLGIEEIKRKYGEDGITEYSPDSVTGKALISDDTQMTLFTACGLLGRDTRSAMRGTLPSPRAYCSYAYTDWLMTQENSFEEIQELRKSERFVSWLLDVPGLYSRRAPGNTCIGAIRNMRESGNAGYIDYIAEKRNTSKGCGAVMRIAPVGLNYSPYSVSRDIIDMEAAQISAITHGHSLGYIPGAMLTHILNMIVYPDKAGLSLREIILESLAETVKLFAHDKHISELESIIGLAVNLSGNGEDDVTNIRKIGEGWVAEETLATAVYCSLKYSDDFSKGIIAAVNHSGDSDSTGAVTGNILGAFLGFDKIGAKWIESLELKDVILEIASDLAQGCLMYEGSDYYDPEWAAKYIDMRRNPGLACKNREESINDLINSSAFDRMNIQLGKEKGTDG